MSSRANAAGLSFLPLCLLSGCAASAGPPDNAFVQLADAYVARDAAAATASYSDDASVVYAYDGVPEERIVGRSEIEASFESFFGRISPDLPLDLNFRIAGRSGSNAHGFYRLRFGDAETSYGRFDVVQAPDGLFASDRSSSATRSDFEEVASPLLVRPGENELDRSYYGLLAGRYRLPDGCDLVVTRSVVRLFVRNTCDQSWRGLDRVSGLQWTGGDSVLPESTVTRYGFGKVHSEPSSTLTLEQGGGQSRAMRDTPYVTRDVGFSSADGTRLAGTIYLPSKTRGPAPATVLVHGSGPQDRDGYASIIAVLADALAAEGRIVLTYDKRGSGGSQGNGNTAGFDVLAQDAVAAMTFLRARDDVAPDKVGLAGSSQAGWVVAKAIELGAQPADVFLLGAAGAAFTVREQNIYNTEVRMACAGIAEQSRKLAIAQQEAFFDALSDRAQAARLDALTSEASQDTAIRDWLFPGSDGLDVEGAWFTVLDPAFDPLPVWKSFAGQARFVFSEFDDSTDTRSALDRLNGIGAKVVVLPAAQHLGLGAQSKCDGELADRKAFSPNLFAELKDFARLGSD